jgi:ABC-type amino acid transport system permease subunit
MRLVILPQALKIVIPPTVSILISAFKDTSLVVIIALFDLLKTTQSVLSNPEWMGFSREAYTLFLRLFFNVELQPKAGEGVVKRRLTTSSLILDMQRAARNP